MTASTAGAGWKHLKSILFCERHSWVGSSENADVRNPSFSMFSVALDYEIVIRKYCQKLSGFCIVSSASCNFTSGFSKFQSGNCIEEELVLAPHLYVRTKCLSQVTDE